jgi:peptidoglycan/xylan/chitin deacetylase (PgdA/CDA1 family)
MTHGALVISLDFELYWGVRDKRCLESYKHNLMGVQLAIPAMLELFHKYEIHATWATVGLLFCHDVAEAKRLMPEVLPDYANSNLSPYGYMQGEPQLESAYHFAPHLIDMIASCSHQEIATHTFSHYYCREPGQTLAAFKADIRSAIAAAETKGLDTRSLVFPRNQWRADYLPILSELGIGCYRGNESSWFYRSMEDGSDNPLRRLGRLVDTYVNLCGHQTYTLVTRAGARPCNFPSSRLLRPYSRRLAPLEPLRFRRIRASLRHAAKTGQVYHLWWHPHNFGTHMEQNMHFLVAVLREFERLRIDYGMQSLNMAELLHLQEAARAHA